MVEVMGGCKAVGVLIDMAARRRQSVSVQEEDAFKMVIDELMEEVVWYDAHHDADLANEWILQVVDYNVPTGKQIRGRGVISAYKSFVSSPSSTVLKDVYALGWLVEIFGAAFYIPEDMMRKSLTRRSKFCWHLVEEVGKGAINDAFLLESLIFFLLDLKFKGQPCHPHLTKMFHKAFYNTCLGQKLDSRIGTAQDFSRFTMTNYFRISKYKVGYFSFYLPMVVAKIMADEGNPDQKEVALIEEISLEMGHLFQVQDDYLDCFGNPDITGRKGTTIQGNRCSWFVVRALQKVDCYQEKLLKDNYGKLGTENVHRVIRLFQELGLVDEYRKYEVDLFRGISTRIAKLPETIPKLFFTETLELILKREK